MCLRSLNVFRSGARQERDEILCFWHPSPHSADEAHGDRSRDSIRAKCTSYLERAEQLKEFLAKKSKKVHSHGSTAAKEKKK